MLIPNFDDIQDTHAHRAERAQLLLPVDAEPPEDIPRDDCQCNVHESRVPYTINLVRKPGRHRTGRGKEQRLTRGKDVIAHVELVGPALAGRGHHPRLLHRPASDPGDDGAGAEHGVDGRDDEPDKALLPARRDAQQRHGERRLAPRGPNDHKGPRERRHEQHRRVVPQRYVVRVLAEAVLDGQRDGYVAAQEHELRQSNY